jgi:CO/xanthine dehydrogenase FAD-binding subunit
MMKLPHFRYFAPRSIEEASLLLARYPKEAYALAGGTDLLVKMRQRRLVPGYLVNLKTIPSMDYVTFDDKEGLRIGALTTIQVLKNSAAVKRYYPALAQACGLESSVQIRNRATVGGNIANGSPAADAPLALTVYDAAVVIAGQGVERQVILEDLLLTTGGTILKPGEIVREVRVPPPAERSGAAYMKHAVRRSDIAIVSVAVLLTMSRDVCADARIGLGSVAPTIIRSKTAEEELRGREIGAEAVRAAVDAAAAEARPIDDIRGGAAYRMETLKSLLGRAINDAVRDARIRGM